MIGSSSDTDFYNLKNTYSTFTGNSHQHVCAWCGSSYEHTHNKGSSIHFQFEKQCPNDKCQQYYTLGDDEQQSNPTNSLLYDGDTSFLFNRDSILYEVNCYKNIFHNVVDYIVSGRILTDKAVKGWLKARVGDMCHKVSDKTLRTHGRTLVALVFILFSRLNDRKIFTNLELEWYREQLEILKILQADIKNKSKAKKIKQTEPTKLNTPSTIDLDDDDWEAYSDD